MRDGQTIIIAALLKAFGQRMPDGSYRAVLLDQDIQKLPADGELEVVRDDMCMLTIYRYTPPPVIVDAEFSEVKGPSLFIENLTNKTD